SPLAKCERPHSSAFDAIPKAAPTQARVPVELIAAVGFGAAGTTIAASGSAGSSEGDGGSGRSATVTGGFSIGASANGTRVERSGGGGVVGSNVAARTVAGNTATAASMKSADSRRVTTSSPRSLAACWAGSAARPRPQGGVGTLAGDGIVGREGGADLAELLSCQTETRERAIPVAGLEVLHAADGLERLRRLLVAAELELGLALEQERAPAEALVVGRGGGLGLGRRLSPLLPLERGLG